ncbi:MAG: tRNA (adenosine(37)-N6)-threonylcarbamoyltransferase complex transferase subunit TsaD [Candidatus Aenigmarchaeota archaeon]|nr:tRNA (adenosine(37)-N6)-threonylcarbamoyltransferase complex transferase subunit TsaD [Candidatus Aenigmarchaeota archaeon]
MRALGIESTAHTFGIGVADGETKEILADERVSYRPESGIIPAECARFLKENSSAVLENLEKRANLSEIDIVAVSVGPGLPPSLSFGLDFARGLAKTLGKPLYGVNHCRAHIDVGVFLTGCTDPVVLYVSGGNTQVIYYNDGYRVLGETQDIGIGNAIDKLGRIMGLKFPAGPKIEQMAKSGKFIQLPYSVKGMDLNFSGILSDCVRRLGSLDKDSLEQGYADLSYSFQEVCFSMLTEVTERAMAAMNKRELLLVGGVAQNRRLQEMLELMCAERGARLFAVPKEYAGDNGPMIAVSALLSHRKKEYENPADIRPNWRLDRP